MTWRWFMKWFFKGNQSPRCTDRTNLLRAAETAEHEAMQRVVSAGVRATMAADEARDAATKQQRRIGPQTEESSEVILTAESVLKLIERDRR